MLSTLKPLLAYLEARAFRPSSMVLDVLPADDGVRRAVQVRSLRLSREQGLPPKGLGVEVLGGPGEAELVYQPGDGDDHVHEGRGPARQRLQESPVGALPHKVARAGVEAQGVPRDDEPVAGSVPAELLPEELPDAGGGADAAVGENVQQDPGPGAAAGGGGRSLGLGKGLEDADGGRDVLAGEAGPEDVGGGRADEEDGRRGEEGAVLGDVLFYVDVSGAHPAEDEDEFRVASGCRGGGVIVVLVAVGIGFVLRCWVVVGYGGTEVLHV